MSVGIRCQLIGLAAGALQALWALAPFVWVWPPTLSHRGWWLAPDLAVCLVVGVGLMVHPGRRAYSWAVLVGSLQGSVAMFALLLAALSAAFGGD